MEKDKLFCDGFTSKSYFNVVMQAAKEIYDLLPVNNSKLNFYFVEDMSINACAYIGLPCQDYIEMNVGTLVHIFAYMKTAMADRMVFREIGNPDKECDAIISGMFDPESRQLYFKGQPVDEERDSIAFYLSLFTIRFVLIHELGHLYNGHLGLLKKLYSIQKSEMFIKAFVDKPSYALDRRTMEMDADAFAATSAMINIMEIYKEINRGDAVEAAYNNLPKGEVLFKLWAFAIHTLFLLFEHICKIQYSNSEWYLPNEARAILAFGAAVNTLDEWRKHGKFICDEVTYKRIRDNIHRGIVEAENYYNRKFGENYNFMQSASENSEFYQYADEVLNYWNTTLEQKLRRFARIQLYNPDTIDAIVCRI